MLVLAPLGLALLGPLLLAAPRLRVLPFVMLTLMPLAVWVCPGVWAAAATRRRVLALAGNLSQYCLVRVGHLWR